LAGLVRIQQWDPADEMTTRACHQILVASHRVDDPAVPPSSYPVFRHQLSNGWERTPGEVWVARAGDSTVTGYYQIGLPDLENRFRAYCSPTVGPATRRRGLGRALLRHAGSRAAAHGRTLLAGHATVGSAGEHFARAAGARPDLEEVRRIQYLRDIDPDAIAALRTSAERAAAGYSLLCWTGPVPEKYCGAVAEVLNAFNDAPHGENEEPEFWDADRIRTRAESELRAGVMRGYTVAARHGAGGEMAAFSHVQVDPERPDWGYQEVTAVTRAHRGRRLGLLVKTAMLKLLARAEPKLEQITTGNAATNEHMIAINEQLGYRVVEPRWRSWELPVASMGGRQS
jgi:GNAT superfamily N-acetyltransferase